MAVQRLARDEEAHDLGRSLEDQVDAEVAHRALHGDSLFAPAAKRRILVLLTDGESNPVELGDLAGTGPTIEAPTDDRPSTPLAPYVAALALLPLAYVARRG